jgi:SAM-dependent methyltransferase
LLEVVGGYDDSFPGMYEDLVVTTKLLLRHDAYASTTCWYHYRQHDRSCTASAAKMKREHAARGRFLRWMEAYLAESKLGDDAVRAALAVQLRPYRRPVRTWLRRFPGRTVRFLDRHMTNLIRRLVGPAGRRWIRDRMDRAPFTPPPGWVRFGSLRRVTPISRGFGWNRGEPIDRFYVESFLRAYAADIKGRVLEVGDATYTRAFGGGKVTRSDVLHAVEGNPAATIVGDLESGRNLPQGAFDCIILTQTVHCLYDARAAVENARRALAPGGVLLATLPGISQVSRYDMDRWGDYWRFTSTSAHRLFADAFGGEDRVQIETFGNVLAAVGLLHGLDRRELKELELAHVDPDYEVTIGVRAVRPNA